MDTDKPSLLDEVADTVPPLTQARQFLANLPADERAEWDALLRAGNVYPASAVIRVFAKRGIVMDRHTCHRIRTETEGYVPAR
jgi:hypothetical protein